MAEHINRIFTCQECSFVFKKRSHLLRHQLIHTNERPYACHICQKSYRSSFHLNRHLATHSGIKSFKCDYEGCDVSCITEWNLKRHIKRTHLGKFKCGTCDKEFRKNKLLQQHMSSEHKNSTICCEFPGCPQIFSVPAKMRHHMKLHTERGYLCPVKDCHLKFSLWSECRRHASQCKNKEINCDVCGKMFTERSNLKAHKKIHSEEREVFLCPYEGCGRFYTKQYNLKAHVQSFHLNIRPFICPKKGCNKSFHFQHLLRNHLENIHGKVHSPSEKEPKKRTRRVNVSTISAITGYIPELQKKMTPAEIKCYVDDEMSLSGNENSPNDTTQAEMSPASDKPMEGVKMEGEMEDAGGSGGSPSSDEFETITELVEITPCIYKPVQRVVRRPHLNRVKSSLAQTSSLSKPCLNIKHGERSLPITATGTSSVSIFEKNESMAIMSEDAPLQIKIEQNKCTKSSHTQTSSSLSKPHLNTKLGENLPIIATATSRGNIFEKNESMAVMSEDAPLQIKIEHEECMQAFSNRFKDMLGKHSMPTLNQSLNIPGSCHIQSMTESDSSDTDSQNKKLQCVA